MPSCKPNSASYCWTWVTRKQGAIGCSAPCKKIPTAPPLVLPWKVRTRVNGPLYQIHPNRKDLEEFLNRLLPRHVRFSHIHVGSILDGWVLEITHDMLGKMKQLTQETLVPRTHLTLVGRQTRGIHLLFQVMVQILIRVQLRCITRQIELEYFQPIAMPRHPRRHLRSPVRPQAIHDPKHLARRAPQ